MNDSLPVELVSRRRGRGMLTAAIVSAIFFMVTDNPAGPLVIDEHVSFWIAGEENPGTLYERSLNYAATPPASSLFQRAALKLGGNRPVVLRSMSWFAFVLAVVFVYFAGASLSGPQLGGTAAIVLAWHPGILDIMRLARPYALSVFLASAGIWVAALWAKKPKNIWFAVLFAVVNAGLLWTHYLNLPLIAVLFATMLFPRISLSGSTPKEAKTSERTPGWLVFAAMLAVGAAAIPLLPTIFRMMDWAPYLNYRTEPPALFDALGPLWAIAFPSAALISILLQRLLRRPEDESGSKPPILPLILLSLLPELALILAGFLSQPSLAAVRYRVVYAPAAAILFSAVLSRFSRLRIGLFAAAAGLGLAWGWIGERPWQSPSFTAQAPADWKQLADELNRAAAPEDPVFVQSGLIESRLVPAFFADPVFMDYVSCRLGRFYVAEPHPRYALPWSGINPADAKLNVFYREKMQEAQQGRRMIWLAVGTDTDLGRAALEQFQTLAESSGFKATGEYQTKTAVLIGFEPVPD